MEFITTTQFRTHSSKIISQLKLGRTLHIFHRSHLVGKIVPHDDHNSKLFTKQNAAKVKTTALKLGLPKLTNAEINHRYQTTIDKKHGQGLSGRK